jgi:hypothetical protein
MLSTNKSTASVSETLLIHEQYFLAAYENGNYVQGSNEDRCLREGLRSIRRSVSAAGLDAIEAQKVQRSVTIDFVEYLLGLFENLTSIVNTRCYETYSNDENWQECLWAIPEMKWSFRTKGFTDAQLYDGGYMGLKGFPSRKYLEKYPIWQSSSLERLFIHHLIVWETTQYGPAAITNQISPLDELTQAVTPARYRHVGTENLAAHKTDKVVTASSLADLKQLRNKSALTRTGIYVLAWIIDAVLLGTSTAQVEIIRNLASWIAVPLTISLCLWTAGSIFGWTIHPFLFRKAITKRLEPLMLLANMCRLADGFLSITSPKQAEQEMLKITKEGAILPSDSWALLYLSINRGDAYWGEELQTRPFYKARERDASENAKKKSSGLLNLSKILEGRGVVDENGDFHDSPRDFYS